MKLILSIVLIVFQMPALAQVVEVNDKHQKGQLENDEKIGVWEYYGLNDELDLKVNHDNGAILYLKPDTSAYYVNINDQWEYTKLDHYPRYLESYFEFYRTFQKKLRAPEEVKEKQTDHIIYLVFDINTDGQAVNVHVENDEEGLFRESVQEAFNLIPNSWIPASLNQQKLTSRFVLPLIIRPAGNAYPRQLKNVPEGFRLSEISIVYYQRISN